LEMHLFQLVQEKFQNTRILQIVQKYPIIFNNSINILFLNPWVDV